MRRLAMAALMLVSATAALQAAGIGLGPDCFKGNDTGGIIAWSPDVARVYRKVAAQHCATYNKVAEITSVHPVYGDYIAFKCHFPRGYDPRKWELDGPPVRVLY